MIIAGPEKKAFDFVATFFAKQPLESNAESTVGAESNSA